MSEETNEKPSKIRFDGTINAGHILTFGGFLLAGFLTYTTLDKRVVVLEENRATQRQVDVHQNEMQRSEMTVIKDSLNEIKRSVERVNDQLASRPSSAPAPMPQHRQPLMQEQRL